MRLKNLDLIVTIAIAVLNILWALLPNHTPVIGIILALPLVLVLPGYTLTEALFHKQSLDASHRLVFSLGLSLAIDVLSGLLLNFFPIGLQAISWSTLLGLLAVIFALLVAYLRRGAAMHVAQPRRFRLSIYQGMLFGLAIVVAILSFVYVDTGVIQQPHPAFTQLWMLPEVQTAKSCDVRLGVRSFESTSVTYTITMTVNGSPATTWPSVVLAPQQEWDRVVPISPTATQDAFIEGRLYQFDKPTTVYREVHVTLHSCPTSQVTPTPSYPALASTYNGTMLDAPTDIPANMSLTGVQQSGGHIQGYFTAGSGLRGSDPFRGMVTTTKHIQFTVTDYTRRATLSFAGDMQSDGTLSGNYCTLEQKGQCNSEYGYGLWSIAPASR